MREATAAGDGVPEPPSVDDGDACVVWHRRHLRVQDHPAVTYATREYDTVCPLFVFDPHFYGDSALACDARRHFLHESLSDLADAYADRDVDLVFARSDPLDALAAFVDRGWEVVATADATSRYGARRDDRAADALDVTFVDDDGLRRGVDDPRDGWADHVESYLRDEPTAPHPSGFGDHGVDSAASVEGIEERYDVTPEKSSVPTGGREAALARLERFLDRIHEYPGSISAPSAAETGTSRLSPYLRFGCLSVREVFRRLERDAPEGRGKEMFRDRLYWNRHYTQKLVDWPGWTDRAVNPVFRGLNRSRRDDELIAAWREGLTGFPLVDASMRCLRETGWLNFRMRAMCASVFGFLLEQPWWIGADHFYEHLIDADPAINYTQWQYQTGLTGVGAVRVYDPRKQVREHDPDGEFVRRWVPELADVPDEYLDAPDRMPLALQEEVGVRIGEDYPRPVVDFEAKRAAARERFGALADRASEAASDPTVRRRLSLSRRGRADDGDGDAHEDGPAAGQSSLDAFE
ncbi:deoxyribodipyrimidine photo-lyase (plasmid) [Halobaculum sp. CBA1158]|uniref:FAD-binding domain-containing protein n=1 Tax=Halobaculum sp. CBA1158 TaxID=2904243 RepID=UPI001F1E0C1F|nr:FAD-binding domain-containing protein [Halobaculum sp. CBA1158]UIP01393.1 deoxyribodipyrimidine photo-lyase [Halobaculum sp. CBA1158]